jgi:hypothetical protein
VHQIPHLLCIFKTAENNNLCSKFSNNHRAIGFLGLIDKVQSSFYGYSPARVCHEIEY